MVNKKFRHFVWPVNLGSEDLVHLQSRFLKGEPFASMSLGQARTGFSSVPARKCPKLYAFDKSLLRLYRAP